MNRFNNYEPVSDPAGQWVKISDVLAATQPLFEVIKDLQEMLGEERMVAESERDTALTEPLGHGVTADDFGGEA